MGKLLSLIVPTYNMEKYLRRCLDSVTREDISDKLEVIVVNDGSKDHSLEIAKEYEKNRPDIVKLIDKENGNYGSCVNAAIPIAKGEYIKMLDADDWYDSSELIKLLALLEGCHVDMFITHYQRCYSNGKNLRIRISDNWQYSKEYSIEQLYETDEFMRLQMHQIAFKTDLLRDMHYHQTEGISYTDAEWTFAPLYHVKRVMFFDADIYRYFIGREGQTMQNSIQLRSVSHETKSLRSMIEYSSKQLSHTSQNLERYFSFRLVNRSFNIFFSALIFMDDASFSEFNLHDLDDYVMHKSESTYNQIEKYDIRGRLIRRWRKTGRREPVMVRKIIGKLWLTYSFINSRINPHAK